MDITNKFIFGSGGNIRNRLIHATKLLRHYHIISQSEYNEIISNIDSGDFD